MRLRQVRNIVAALICVIFLVGIWHDWIAKLSSQSESEMEAPTSDGVLDTTVVANPYEQGKYLSSALKEELDFLKRNDLEFKNAMERVAQLRRNRLKDACSKANLSRPLPAGFSITDLPYQPVLLVSDAYKAMFCFTGDVYSEVWRELLGFSDVRSIYSYRPESIAYRMKYYFKFMVAQDPLLRLMDAYHFSLSSPDKRVIINEKGEDISETLLTLSQKIRSDYHAPVKHAAESRLEQAYALFQDFATYIVQKTFLNEPHHYLWERIHIVCSPCSINYDFISLAESASNDARYLASKLSVPTDRKIFPTEMDSNIAISSLSKFIKDFGFDLLEKVLKLYENDYMLFGYKPIKP